MYLDPFSLSFQHVLDPSNSPDVLLSIKHRSKEKGGRKEKGKRKATNKYRAPILCKALLSYPHNNQREIFSYLTSTEHLPWARHRAESSQPP